MTMTWLEAKKRLEPRYSVSNEPHETAYSIPVGKSDGEGQLELRFRPAQSSDNGVLRDYRDLDLEYALRITGHDGEPIATVTLTKDNVVTLQKLLTSVLEHSRVRRFEWLAEQQSGRPSPA